MSWWRGLPVTRTRPGLRDGKRPAGGWGNSRKNGLWQGKAGGENGASGGRSAADGFQLRGGDQQLLATCYRRSCLGVGRIPVIPRGHEADAYPRLPFHAHKAEDLRHGGTTGGEGANINGLSRMHVHGNHRSRAPVPRNDCRSSGPQHARGSVTVSETGMAEENTAELRNGDILRQWRGRVIGARAAQQMRELLRREAAGEFSVAELSEELRRLVTRLGKHGPSE